MPESQVNSDCHLFVLALDGATFDLLGPWMAQGHLPNLRAVFEAGVHGPLESSYPPLTAPAWASFMTGKLPAGHGLLEFFRRDPGSYRLALNSRTDIDGRSIWGVLSDAGRHVGVLSVPLTWPPEAVRGFLVSGLLTPRQDNVVFTYPKELADELRDTLGSYILQHNEKYVTDDPDRLLREECAILENRIDAAQHLMSSRPWDFFMLHVLGGDVLQHAFWHDMDPDHPQHTSEGHQRYGSAILDFYRRVDARLPELLRLLPEDTYVMVMSDHGFGPLVKYINFNTWLLHKGFIQLRRSVWTRLRHLAFRLGYDYRLVWEIGARTGIVRWIIRLGRGGQERAQRKVFLSLDDVDWSRTRVYSAGNYGQLYVNLKGREPQGCVEPGEHYERVLQELEAALRQLRDPESGEPVVGEIWRGAELWQGPYADRAPDLFFFTRDMKYKAMGLSDFGSNRVFDDLYGTRAHHRMNGIFMLSGPKVKANQEIAGARIVDLAPTIYHLMGVAIPPDLDGRVLRQAFTDDLAERPPVYEGVLERVESRPETGYTPQEEAALTEMLRDLGYVD